MAGTGTKPPQNTLNERTRDACGRMANEAQWAANKAIEQARVDPRSGNALGWFDSIFSEQYLGHPIATLRQGWDLKSGTGLKGSKIDSFWRGSTGFKGDYKDSQWGSTNNGDQTHHFAAYLSAGINGLGFSSFAHQMGDVAQLNLGDVWLGSAGYNIGEGLRVGRNNLSQIGDDIRKVICDDRKR